MHISNGSALTPCSVELLLKLRQTTDMNYVQLSSNQQVTDADMRIEDKHSDLPRTEKKRFAMQAKTDVRKTSTRLDKSDMKDVPIDAMLLLSNMDSVNVTSAAGIDVEPVPDDIFLRRKRRRRCVSRGNVFGK